MRLFRKSKDDGDFYQWLDELGISASTKTREIIARTSRETGRSPQEVFGAFMLANIEAGKNPVAGFPEEQRKAMTEAYPEVAKAYQRKFGSEW